MANPMNDWERRINSLPQAERLKALAQSPEGQRLAKQLDPKTLEQLSHSQDPAALKSILAQVLSSPEGKALAQQLQAAMKQP